MKKKNWILEMKCGHVAHYFNTNLLDAYKSAVADGYFPIAHFQREHYDLIGS